MGSSRVAVESDVIHRIFVAMKYQHLKRHAIIGSYTLHPKTHFIAPLEAGMAMLLTVDLDFPLEAVAPYRHSHLII